MSVKMAANFLNMAIDLHKKHMDGSEKPTMKSQEKMMIYMELAKDELAKVGPQ